MRNNIHSLVLAGIIAALTVSASPSLMAQAKGQPVEIAMPQKQAMPERLIVTGTLRANEVVAIASEIAGTIKRMPFSNGGLVKQGQLILELNDDVLAAELRQAEASYELAKLRHQRNETLLKKKSVAQSIYDESAAELNERHAAREVAQVKLAKARITAPFDGYITLRDASVGAYVTPGEALFVIVDDTPLKLDFRIPERSIGAVTPKSTVQFEINTAGRIAHYQAEVQALQPAITPDSHTLFVRATYANEQREILAGTFAKVRISLGGDEPVLSVPEEALVANADGYILYVVIDGKAKVRDVDVGVRRGGLVAIKSGLEEGVPVITAGHQMLADDTPVNVVMQQD